MTLYNIFIDFFYIFSIFSKKIINKKNIFPNTLLNVLRDKYENKERPPMKVSSAKPNNPTLASGGHPNEFGHIEIANMLYNYIKEID